MNPTVSLITISQLSRNKCLTVLHELIRLQTYENIIEWIIVEGSNNQEDADKNKLYIEELIQNKNMNIFYIEFINSENKLSDLRNIGNDTSKGDIIICMDDDDYYPEDRVSHAVHKLTISKKLIAGCSSMYMYDYFLKSLFKFDKFGENHSTNNCMAYKREYLSNHRYHPGLKCGEESSFTNNFSEPMVQLMSTKCIVCSSHDTNTYSKKDMCMNSIHDKHSNLKKINKDIINYIPLPIFNKLCYIWD
jgi:glycosyltransferase involved in cell wall biosynthesis